jgi:hypothetical protein
VQHGRALRKLSHELLGLVLAAARRFRRIEKHVSHKHTILGCALGGIAALLEVRLHLERPILKFGNGDCVRDKLRY